ncbi:MAG: hypothetical protein L3K04_00340 [Thermoplasmata archaeon]|nr:hypothetical protein [Thermoplasmata archaeon]MCI4338125.1 hypothetical protein [Thermoplasmata archaeon]MCI4342224.1 hypothetical protein [Thermoplasmata archaeon]
MSPSRLPGEPALWERLRAAEPEIQWRELPVRGGTRRPGAIQRRSRVARLHDEEARLDEREGPNGHASLASSGPVGALLVLLAIGRYGRPDHLRGRSAGEAVGFPEGAIEALWGSISQGSEGAELPIEDLLALVRYAL